jgi:hypothetical protein
MPVKDFNLRKVYFFEISPVENHCMPSDVAARAFRAFKEKRQDIPIENWILHQDNETPHTADCTKLKKTFSD